ncbi:hypothetical protein KPG71_14410 [Roseovarius sp. PS-C2]|uniref:hypothetical protein n=1 Tax=Roseovarius sp. PS-C2 TaxID=2820814 RepID=UPI001C0E7B7B|nr:hypothetical protein [Roseovarius sp. PS-C2]MBU3261214.1 hypothetical protein [Roseovarius sp. PS-C2]
MVEAFLRDGWVRFAPEDSVRDWAHAARVVAAERVADAGEQSKWLQCGGTWFVGVDTLPNGPDGTVGRSAPLRGAATELARRLYGALPLHCGQVSVIYPGYPRPRDGESDAAFGYRAKRDAAHVDGVLAVGPDRRRMLKERHAYILGLPLTSCDAGASPFVIWEGSHLIMRDMFMAALGQWPETEWAGVDLTAVYQAARRALFDKCKRVEIAAKPGEAYLVHRFALHGVAPWAEGAQAPEEGRMIVYFRPEFIGGTRDWLELP